MLCFVGRGWGQMVSPLAKAPHWQELERFQETMTREEFVQLLDGVYAPRQAAIPSVRRARTVSATSAGAPGWSEEVVVGAIVVSLLGGVSGAGPRKRAPGSGPLGAGSWERVPVHFATLHATWQP